MLSWQGPDEPQGRVRIERRWRASALVLLHSTVCDRRMWDPQWPVLADAGYRVVRCDFRGYGEMPVPQCPHDDAGDVLDLAGELGVGPVAVAGASYGGKVALEIAARWPQQVTALALVCAGMPGQVATQCGRFTITIGILANAASGVINQETADGYLNTAAGRLQNTVG